MAFIQVVPNCFLKWGILDGSRNSKYYTEKATASGKRETKSNLLLSGIFFLAKERNVLLRHALPKKDPMFLGAQLCAWNTHDRNTYIYINMHIDVNTHIHIYMYSISVYIYLLPTECSLWFTASKIFIFTLTFTLSFKKQKPQSLQRRVHCRLWNSEFVLVVIIKNLSLIKGNYGNCDNVYWPHRP